MLKNKFFRESCYLELHTELCRKRHTVKYGGVAGHRTRPVIDDVHAPDDVSMG